MIATFLCSCDKVEKADAGTNNKKENITVEISKTGTYEGHDYVDLGLSVMWATCNIGATNPEDYGQYFAWGETKPQANNDYSWSSYKFYNDYNQFDKYNKSDRNTELDSEDDAATVNWGGNWRMPTIAEVSELESWCTSKKIEKNGVKGRLLTSKRNGNTMFMPAAGYREDGNLYYEDSYYEDWYYGTYWLRSLSPFETGYAYDLILTYSYFTDNEMMRKCGLTVRAVSPRIK